MNQQIDKNLLVTLGLKHKFLNWVEHDTPPNFFTVPIECYLDDENGATATYEDVATLHELLCAIYAEVDIV